MTADELKAAFAALPPMEPVAPEHSWRFWAWDLRENVRKNDPEGFLTWPIINLTMFVGNAPYIDYEYNELPFEYLVKLEDLGIGKPVLYEISEYVTTSGNLIHQAYHLWQWEQNSGGWLPELETIVEIGGGYGAMALICHRLGFRGRYIILDLPEFSLLQQYYLSNVGIDGVEFHSTIDQHFDADLLIGLYSLNEMPLKDRARILQLCPARSYLIAYGAAWGGWDNMGWAREFMIRKGYLWHNWNIPHLTNCWYLVGVKRE
jgi:hypothetical protein